MVTLSTNLALIFGVASLAVFVGMFVSGKEWKNMSLSPERTKELPGQLKSFALVVVPFVLVLFVAHLAQLDAMYTQGIGWFVAGAAAPFVLSMLNLTPFLRGILLLALSVLLTVLIPAENFSIPIVATMAGLIVSKLSENLLPHVGNNPRSFEDFLPPFVWLTASYWLETSSLSKHVNEHEALVLGTIVVALFLRWAQSPILHEDKYYWKRMILATTGGLLVLILLTKGLLLMEMAKIAALAGVGFFLAYLFQQMEPAEGTVPDATKAIKQIIFIGIFTLLATRVFGTLGLCVLAPTAIVATRPGVAYIAGLFWTARILLQAFIFQYNPNVTGVNITHMYASAALYAGFVMVLAFSLLMRDCKDRRMLAIFVLAGGSVAPVVSNYLLHAEPTGGFLVATLVASVLVAVFGPVLYKEPIAVHDNIALLPAQTITFALMSAPLIELGNTATTEAKMKALAILAALAVCIWIVNYFIFSRPQQKPAEAPAADA